MAKFCPFCGVQLEDENSFCYHCGKQQPDAESGSLLEQTPLSNSFQGDPPSPIPEIPTPDVSFANTAETNVCSEPVKPPKKFSKKQLILLISGAAVLLLIVLALVIFFILKGTEQQHLLMYQKNDEVRLTLPELDGENFSFVHTSDYSSEVYGAVYDSKQKNMLYIDQQDSENRCLYYQPLNGKALRKGERLLISDHVEEYGFSFSKDEKSVYYLEEDGRLYRYDLSKQEPESLFSDVSSFYFDAENDRLYFLNTDDGLFFKDPNGKEPSRKIAADIKVFVPSKNGKTVYYQKEDSLYAYDIGQDDSQRLTENIDSIVQLYPDGTCYFTTNEETSRPLKELINDDMAKADQAEKEGQDILSFSRFVDAEWYGEKSESSIFSPYVEILSVSDNKLTYRFNDYIVQDFTSEAQIQSDGSAVTVIDMKEGGEVHITFTLSKKGDDVVLHAEQELVREAEEGKGQGYSAVTTGDYTLSPYFYEPTPDYEWRDKLRQEIENNTYAYTNTILYYYNGTEIVRVAENISEAGTYLNPAEKPIIEYSKELEEEPFQVNLSEANKYTTVGDLAQLIDSGRESNTVSQPCFAVNGVETSIDVNGQFAQSFQFNEDYSAYYYLLREHEEDQTGTLYRVKVSDGGKQQPEALYQNVSLFLLNGSQVWYYQNVSEDRNTADLYVDGKCFAKGVAPYLSTFLEDGKVMVMKDYRQDSLSGTLVLMDNGTETEIAQNVHDYAAYDSSYIAMIQNYSTESYTGELFAYDGGKELIFIDRDVSSILWLQ